MDLNTATAQIINKAFILKNTELNNFVSNPDLYFLEYQSLNEYYAALAESTSLYENSLTKMTDEGTSQFLTFCITAGLLCLLSLIFIWPIFIYVNKNQEDILKLFLEIPLNKVKYLFHKCEQLQNSIELGEEDNTSENGEIEIHIDDDDSSQLGVGRKRKKRKYKYESQAKKQFFLKYFLVIVLLQSYFVATFFLSQAE